MKFAPYTSGRLKQLKVGITSYSEEKTPFEVVGNVSVGGSITVNKSITVNNISITSTTSVSEFSNLNISGVSTFNDNAFFSKNVAIGTDNVNVPVGVSNTSILAVGILTANRIYSTVYGEFTGGSVVAGSIVGTALSISGISTFGGNVGIGTNDPTKAVGAGNTAILAVGILTANRIYSTVFGEFTGGTVVAGEIVGTGLSISGISTLGTVQISSGIVTATSGVVTYFGDGSNLTGTGNTTNVTTNNLNVLGFSTFTNLVDVNAELNTQGGRIVGAATSNVIPFLYANYSDLPSAATYHGAFAHVHATGKAYYAHAGNWFELVNKEADGTVGTGTERYNIGPVDATTLDVSGITTLAGNINLGHGSDDDQINVNGKFISRLVPLTDITYDIGDSIKRWKRVYAGTFIGNADVGILTATGADINGDLDVDGHTNLDNVSVAGVSTFGSNKVIVGGATTDLLVNGDARVTGELKVGDGTIVLNSTGVSTFPTSVNIGPVAISSVTTSNFPLDVNVGGNLTVGSAITFFSGTGIVTATSYRGDGSELVGVAKSSVLEDNGINPIGVSTFNNLDVTGITTIAGNLVANGNIIGDGATNISGINSVTATSFFGDGSGLENVGVDTGNINTNSLQVLGVSTFTGNIDANGQLDVDGLTSLDDLVVTGFGTFSNTLKVGSTLDVDGAVDLGSHVNIAGVTTIAGDITVGGNITGDGSTVISGVTSVIATKLYGDGENITGINADTIGDLSHLKVTGLSTFVGNAQFDSNVSIAGTLTYEDVTNVDSIGVITARSGIIVGAGISAVGIVTANSFVGSGNNLTALNANNLSSGVVPDARFPATLPAASGANLTSLNASELSSGTVPDGRFPATLPAASGVNLTNVSAVFATKAGIATYTSSWTVTANGASAYRFSGPGNLSTQDNPTIYLVRGQQYEFDLNASGHPFLIRVGSGGTQYTDGVTTVGNNQTGKIRFDVPMDAPSELFYQCQYHSGMLGKFEITDGSKIVQGNSKVEVVDTGSNGYVKVETEGTERLRINSSGHVVPGTDSQYDIGTNTVRFANIYGDVLYGDGSNLTGITAAGTGAIGGLTIKSETGAVVGTAGSVATIDFNNSTGVTVTATSGAAGIASVVIAGVGTDTSINTTGIITATFSGDGQDLDKVSIGSTDGNFIGKGYLQAQKTVNAGGDRGDANIILGRFAGCCHDGGSYNVYLGDQAGRKSTGSNTDRNIFIGCQAGCGNTTGYHNVFLGSEAGKGVCGDSGSVNLFAGLQAGMRNTGCYNIAFGKASYGRETGTKNISIGYMAANDVGAGGTSNVFIGDCAGYNAQVNGPPFRGGMSNVYLGTAAGYQNPGDFNIGIGDNSLNGNSSVSAGCRNIALGQCSGNDIQSGVDNIMLGSCAGAKITTGSCNILLGYNSGCNATGSFRNVYVGTNIGKTVCGGAYDISLGSSNLCEAKWACNNIAIGKNIFQKANCQGPSADALFNIGIGDAVGTGLTTGGYNLMLGYLTGYCLTCACDNIIFGKRAGWKASESTKNIFIGCYAGRSQVSAGCAGQANIAIGNLAGSQTSSTSDRNIFIGNRAGVEATGGCFNIALGADAGSYVTGDRNIFIGQYSGFNQNVSGDKNVVIGDAVCLLSATGNTQLVIGAGATHWIDGDSSFNVTLAGVATATKSTGVFEATKFCGDGSCLTNVTATEATNFTVTANNSTDETVYPVFVDGATGSQGAETDTGLNYNPSSGILNATKYCGDGSCLTGIDTGLSVDACINVITNNTCSGCNLDGSNASHQARDNVFIGCCAAASATYAHNSIMIGACAGKNVTTGGYNIFFGDQAGCTATTGSKNLFIGRLTGADVCGTSSENVFIGHRAGRSAQASSRNIMLGVDIMTQGGSVGNDNILVGRSAVDANVCRTTGFSRNIIVGHYAAYCASSSGCNLILGNQAGYSITSGCSNIIFGKCAVGSLSETFTGNYNFIAGCHAGCTMTSGSSNVMIGRGTGQNLTTGNNNVAIGNKALSLETVTGSENVMIGFCAGKCTCSGSKNVFIGHYAGRCHKNNMANVAIGPNAMSNGRGAGNVVLGNYALGGDHTGSNNFIGGYNAGVNMKCGSSCNILLGGKAGTCLVCGDHNFIVGCCVNVPDGNGNCQLAFGVGNCHWITGDANFNIGIGTNRHDTVVGSAITAKLSVGIVSAYQLFGDGSCLTGIDAGFTPDSQENLYAGTSAGASSDADTCFNIGIGYSAGNALNSGDDNILLGCNAGTRLTSGSANIVLGKLAGQCITSSLGNVIIGCKSACAGTSYSDGSVVIGKSAAMALNSQSGVFIGAYSSQLGSGGNCSIHIGRSSGYMSSGSRNIFIGHYSGGKNTGGDENIFFGRRAGCDNTTGCYNIAIGCEVNVSSATTSCELAIGVSANRWIIGNSSFNVGIKTTSANTDLQVGAHYGVVGGGGTFTAAAGVAHTINEYTISSTDFKTAEYTIFANTGSKIQSQKLLVMQDGTTAYSQEYAVMSSDTLLVSADATLASGVVKIEITPESGVTGLTTFRFTRHTML